MNPKWLPRGGFLPRGSHTPRARLNRGSKKFAFVIYESIDDENSGALAEIKRPNENILKLKIPLTKHYEPSGSGETEMSDITFNEQEKEAVETTAIVHAMAQFEIPCILFRSSYIGKHVKNNIARSEFEVQANSEVQIAFIFGSVCLEIV